MIFSMAFYGFPFATYIFTNETVYMNEKCNQTQIDSGIMCVEAQEALQNIWTIGVMIATAAPIIFGYVQENNFELLSTDSY